MNKCEQYCRTIQRLCNGVKPLLPPEYQQVEYLRSNGTQYINTGIVCSTIRKLQITLWTDRLGNATYPFGGQAGSTGNYWSAVQEDGTRLGYNIGGYANYYYQYVTQPCTQIITTHNGSIDIADGNGVVYSGTYSTSDFNSNNMAFYLFRMNYKNAPYGQGSVTIYRFRIYTLSNEKDVLSQDLIPCYRKSDNKPGMYYLVSKTFFTNSGTGEFTVGPVA